jgi:hypothetical protein
VNDTGARDPYQFVVYAEGQAKGADALFIQVICKGCKGLLFEPYDQPEPTISKLIEVAQAHRCTPSSPV